MGLNGRDHTQPAPGICLCKEKMAGCLPHNTRQRLRISDRQCSQLVADAIKETSQAAPQLAATVLGVTPIHTSEVRLANRAKGVLSALGVAHTHTHARARARVLRGVTAFNSSIEPSVLSHSCNTVASMTSEGWQQKDDDGPQPKDEHIT